ncbi:MAG: SseB family protein [Rhodobacteraceae bacterium]|jgi:hypothetical protein|nr:SseB family protein [Paracoccaceae bacterium]
MTALDQAYQAMAAAAADDDAPRLRYYACLADGEMILMLDETAPEDTITPRIFSLESGDVVLIFDSEEKLAAFSPASVPYAALPGRVVAQQLAGRGIGLAVNMGAPSMMLFPPDAVDWLAEVLQATPTETAGQPVAFHAPDRLPQALLQALQDKLGRSGGLAAAALLAGVGYAGGRRGHLLALLDAAPDAQGKLARAASEALIFSGVEAGEMDVVFLASDAPVATAMARVALRLDLTPVATAAKEPPAPPGTNPEKPPILR